MKNVGGKEPTAAEVSECFKDASAIGKMLDLDFDIKVEKDEKGEIRELVCPRYPVPAGAPVAPTCCP